MSFVGCINYKNDNKLFICDYIDNVLERKWHYNNGYISFTVKHTDDKRKELYLHNFVMDKLTFDGKGQHHTIDHINRVPLDNRTENLRSLSSSHQNINQSKRSRKITLPENSDIDPNDIPKNIYYVKARSNHGDRFSIELKLPNNEDFRWFSTSSKTLNIKVKLQHAIEKLFELKDTYPELNYLIETIDNVHIRNNLRKSFNDIIKLTNFDNDIIEQNILEM